MRIYIKNLGKNILLQVLSFFIVVVVSGSVVFAWTSLDRNTAATWLPLTSTMMQSVIDRLNDALVPTGAVMAFNLSNCPGGWTEYTPAYGRFIRGIDKSGTSIDPDGLRVSGNIQADAFQGHWHSLYRSTSNNPTGGSMGGQESVNNTFFTNDAIRAPVTDGVNGTPRVANETRSKNVALLYCSKN